MTTTRHPSISDLREPASPDLIAAILTRLDEGQDAPRFGSQVAALSGQAPEGVTIADVTVRQERALTDQVVTGWRTHQTATVTVARATWTRTGWSHASGTTQHGCTIVEILRGGLDDGEGWASLDQYAWETILTDRAVAGFLALTAESERLPRSAGWEL